MSAIEICAYLDYVRFLRVADVELVRASGQLSRKAEGRSERRRSRRWMSALADQPKSVLRSNKRPFSAILSDAQARMNSYEGNARTSASEASRPSPRSIAIQRASEHNLHIMKIRCFLNL